MLVSSTAFEVCSPHVADPDDVAALRCMSVLDTFCDLDALDTELSQPAVAPSASSASPSAAASVLELDELA